MIAVKLSQLSVKLLDLPKMSSPSPPTSMTLVKSFKLTSGPLSVAKHGDMIFFGLSDGRIMQLNNRTDAHSIFAGMGKGIRISGIHIDNSEIYILSEENGQVNVYDLNLRRHVRSWKHHSSRGYYNQLRVLNDKVIIPSRTFPALTMYSLQGKLLKEITVPGMTNDYKALAVYGDDSVILSDCGSDRVSRINIERGEVMWASKHVQGPEGIVCYKDGFVLVTNSDKDTRIWILDINTGESQGYKRFLEP